jgi:hypothetical protein
MVLLIVVFVLLMVRCVVVTGMGIMRLCMLHCTQRGAKLCFTDLVIVLKYKEESGF